MQADCPTVISIATEDDALAVVTVTGPLEVNGARCLKERCHEATGNGIRHLILDLSGATFISSSGVGALLLIHEDLLDSGGTAWLVDLAPEIRSVVKTMGLEGVLNILDSEEEARVAYRLLQPS